MDIPDPPDPSKGEGPLTNEEFKNVIDIGRARLAAEQAATNDNGSTSRRERTRQRQDLIAGVVNELAARRDWLHFHDQWWAHTEATGWVPASDSDTTAACREALAAATGEPPETVTALDPAECRKRLQDIVHLQQGRGLPPDPYSGPWRIDTGQPVKATMWRDAAVRITDTVLTAEPADKTIFSPHGSLPHNWGNGPPDTWPPQSHAFIAATVGDDAADWCAAMIGRTLCGAAQHHAIPILVGPGRTGKSTLLRLITLLAGEAHSTAVTSIEHLGSRFGVARIANTALVTLPDLPHTISRSAEAQAGLALIKQISGYDAVAFERKGGNTERRQLRLTLWAASNFLPKWASTAEDSGAWERRIVPFGCHQPVPTDQADPELADRLAASEGEPLARWCCELWRQAAAGELTEPDGIGRERKRLIEASLPLPERWASDCLHRAGIDDCVTADQIRASCQNYLAGELAGDALEKALTSAVRAARRQAVRVERTQHQGRQRRNYYGLKLTNTSTDAEKSDISQQHMGLVQ